jgi:nitroreductase
LAQTHRLSANLNKEITASVPEVKRGNILPGVHEIFQARWSPRAFSDRPVSDEDLKTILEAGRWAASSYNEQPWRFIVGRKFDRQTYDRLLNVLVPYNQGWASLAPVLMITVARRTFSHNGQPNQHARHDTGAALAHIFLQATALGLHAHGMAGFDAERARLELGIPEDYEPVAAVALGYLGPMERLPEPYRQAELAPRRRKPLDELIFDGRWDAPLKL